MRIMRPERAMVAKNFRFHDAGAIVANVSAVAPQSSATTR